MKILELMRRNKLLVFVFVAYAFLFSVMPDKAYMSVNNSMYYVIEMLEIMPVIFVLTAIIETWVPKEVIIKGFGKEAGIKGGILSFILGSISAGPIYAAFPVCKMLLKKGASIGNIVIIMSAWAVIKVPMLANESKFLGMQFMAIRWILTVISIIAMSLIVASIVKEKDIPGSGTVGPEHITGVAVNRSYCLGCGLCANLSPDDFEMAEGKARWINGTLEDDDIFRLRTVMGKCSAKAIDFN